MRRLLRPAAFAIASFAAIVGFAAAGSLISEPVRWTDIDGWLDQSDPVDALAEIARWIGLLLAIYLAAVSTMALVAELTRLRMPRLNRVLHRAVGLVALPSLRHRLLEVTTAATFTATSLQASSATAAPGSRVAALVVDAPAGPDPWPELRGEFHGFGPAGVGNGRQPEGTHLVREGDTLWRIVKDHYGRVDWDLVRRVMEANPQITDPDLILVAWIIRLPALEPDEVATAPVRVNGESTWTVATAQHDDTLWAIVERHYGYATADLVWAVVAANLDVDDPDLIYPGQQITLPPAPGSPLLSPEPRDTTDTVPRRAKEAENQHPPPPASTRPHPPVTDAPAGPPDCGRSTVPDVVAAEPGPAPHRASPATVDSTSPAASALVGEDTTDTPGPSLAQVIGWTGGAGLAAALLGLAARRRRRLPRAERIRRPTDRAVELGVALRETENLTTVDWAAGALRAMATRLRTRPGEPTPIPRLLRLAGEQIELVWDTPNPDALDPWRTFDGGWSWRLDRTIEPDTTDLPSPCPCFVTVGTRDGADVLLNLESCGAVAIAGDTDVAAALTRSVATELSASAFSDTPTILVVNGAQLPGEPDHARVVEVVEAVGWLRDRRESATALLAHRRLTSLFALRARSRPHDGHEAVIVLADTALLSDTEIEELVGLANGDLGAIVIVAGRHASVSWNLECTPRTVEVQPLGLTLDAVGLPEHFDCVIEEVIPDRDPTLDEGAEAGDDVEPAEADVALADHLNDLPLPENDDGSSKDDESEWDVELKVLGQVRSVGTKEPLTPTELHLAIYLAFHRHGENSDTIATMVWPKGVAERTMTNAMASLRRKLGTGSDGEPLFPLGRESQYLYRLSPRVVTDWDRFVSLTRGADESSDDEAVALLDEALGLVDGPPFRAQSGYSWAYSDGTATLITETVRTAARRCVELHLQRGERVEAGFAASQAGKASDAEATDESWSSA